MQPSSEYRSKLPKVTLLGSGGAEVQTYAPDPPSHISQKPGNSRRLSRPHSSQILADEPLFPIHPHTITTFVQSVLESKLGYHNSLTGNVIISYTVLLPSFLHTIIRYSFHFQIQTLCSNPSIRLRILWIRGTGLQIQKLKAFCICMYSAAPATHQAIFGSIPTSRLNTAN